MAATAREAARRGRLRCLSSYGESLYIADASGTPFSAGRNDGQGHDYIGLVVGTYTDTRIQYQLGSAYSDHYQPQGVYAFAEGDAFRVVVGAASCSGTVRCGSGSVPLTCSGQPQPKPVWKFTVALRVQ